MGEYECVLNDPQAGLRLKISRSLQLVLRFVIRYAYAEDSTMVNVRHYGPAGTTPDEPALALFQKQWQLYRKVVDYNYLFHREAYNCLRRILVDEAIQPFRFLDVACGDASATVEALKGTQVASYHGIDLSEAALELASQALETLACPVTLDRRDFVEALRDRPESVDVAWIGLSLHHLQTPEKLSVMRQMRSVVGDWGHFLIYENATPDDEGRDDWLRRWDDQKPWWTALAPEEWDAGRAHVYANDFPETTSRWHALGHEAGFGKVRELFVAPTNLFRVYRVPRYRLSAVHF
jgi:ubiquinone/menaquinone biosynthesis C-methylase UbiE